jgi:hypothetical protein
MGSRCRVGGNRDGSDNWGRTDYLYLRVSLDSKCRLILNADLLASLAPLRVERYRLSQV